MSEFTLPDGRVLLLKVWSEEDMESLSEYVRQLYLSRIEGSIDVLPEAEWKACRSYAVKTAKTLEFWKGMGRELLLSNDRGMAFGVYLLIKDPPFSFDEFYDLIFPKTITMRCGYWLLKDIFDTAYNDFVTKL